MEMITALFGIAAAIALGAMSPGPSFIMIARTALALSRKDALAASLGMGVGAVLFATVAIFGLLSALNGAPALFFVLKASGGGYLVYLGYKMVRGAKQRLVVEEPATRTRSAPIWRSFMLGLATQVSNPKTAIIYASIFASLLPSELPEAFLVVLPIVIFTIEAGWYSMVAIALSAPSPRARYLASRAAVDRTVGTMMSLLGAKLIFEASQS